MNLKKVLRKENILPQLQAETKQAVIEELVDFMAENGSLSDRETGLKAVLDREAKMSTGMQHGIAIPHGKTDAVDELLVVIGIHRDGIEFEAMDHQPSRIFIMTLSPANRTGPHIQFLAEVSKLLSQEALRNRLIAARTREEMLSILTS